MDSGIIWLVGLVLLEAAVFVFVLFLVRLFTRSSDAAWPRESVSASRDAHADAAQRAGGIADERERAAG